MAPPVVIFVGVSLAVAGVVGVAIAAQQHWEPRIKPELQKVQHAARALFTRRRSRKSSVASGVQQPTRDASPDARDASSPGDGRSSPFERAVYSAFQLPQERDGNSVRHRTNRSMLGVATPNETVEMAELDRSIPPLAHPTLTPGQFSVGSSTAPSVAGDPFEDPQSRNIPHNGLISPPLSQYSTLYSTDPTNPFVAPEATPSSPEQASGLQFNVAVLRDPIIPRVPSSVSATNSWRNVSSAPLQHDHQSGVASVRSPWSGGSDLSSSGWTDGGAADTSGNPAVPLNASLSFAPPTLSVDHAEFEDGDNFSIGSYDDIASHSTADVSQGRHSQDEEEPPSPPHYSAPMSPAEGRTSGGSSAGWESVRSPSMSPSSDGQRRRLS